MSAARPERPVRKIWLCADDYGIAPGVDRAIGDLVARGRLNAASVMVVAPGFDRAQARALAVLNKETRRVAIGLHVTLTAPFRPLSRGFAPLAEGAFLPLPALFRAAFARRLDRATIAAEIRAQLSAFHAAFGRGPDFVDGHQHVHLLPRIRDALLAVMAKSAPKAWVRQCASPVALPFRLGDRKGLVIDALSRAFARRARAAGIATNAAFAGTYAFDDGADFAALFPRFLRRMPDNGLIMCHPGIVDDELRRLDPLTTLREREYAFLRGDRFPALLASERFALA